MPKFLDHLKKKIWKSNLDDKSRVEIYQEIGECSNEVCTAIELLAEKLKQRKICKLIRKEVVDNFEEQTGTHGDNS